MYYLAKQTWPFLSAFLSLERTPHLAFLGAYTKRPKHRPTNSTYYVHRPLGVPRPFAVLAAKAADALWIEEVALRMCGRHFLLVSNRLQTQNPQRPNCMYFCTYITYVTLLLLYAAVSASLIPVRSCVCILYTVNVCRTTYTAYRIPPYDRFNVLPVLPNSYLELITYCQYEYRYCRYGRRVYTA